jgi:hypothetical protein
MDMPITYEEARRLYPEAAEEAIGRLRKSRSRFRKAAPETLKWKLSWGVETRSNTFAEILNGSARQHQQEQEAMSVQERTDDECSRVRASVMVANYYGRIVGCPDVIRKTIEVAHTAAEQERLRFAALTDEERAEENRKTLKSLKNVAVVRFK